MFCLVCGAKIDDEAVSCPVCGSAVKISPPHPEEEKTSIKREDKKSEICPACGFVHDAGMLFCPRCGMRQSLYFKDGLNNEQTDINRFEKFPEARGRGPRQDFDKYAAPQSREPGWYFEKHADMANGRYDFEKHPEHASAPRRSLMGLLVAAAVVIAAVAIAVYFFM
jgi:uncharacterized Zn finger protein (UPF0148 family)